jgi:hypothetical protein
MIESSTIEALIMTLMITFGIIFVTFLVNVLTLPGITRDIVVSKTTKINIVNMVISIILILVIGRNHPYGNHQ